VATAFAGFTGIVVVLGRRSQDTWGVRDRAALSLLLASSLGVVFFAFAPDLVRTANVGGVAAWRVSSFVFASYHLALIVFGLLARHRNLAAGVAPLGPKPLELTQFAVGLVIVLGQFLAAAGLLPAWLFFLYLLGMLWLLAIATFAFAFLLLSSVA
jgi:hypothetical protein